MVALAFVLALTGASPIPAPSPAPVSTAAPPLKEIGTVNAMSPYCATFYNHFNAAVRPMLETDRQLDDVSTSLDNINDLFTKLDWNERFYDERLRIEREVGIIERTNFQTQQEVNALRAGERFTSDPARAHQIHMLAQEMQRALDKQKQIGTDMHSMLITMMDYDLGGTGPDRPPGGHTLEELSLPKDMRDIKAFLRFDGLRDRLHDAEGMAAGYASTISQTYC